jgi:hypothetical protein
VHVQRLVLVNKTATVLVVYTTEEQRSALHFLWAKGLNVKDINKEMFSVYGEKCVSCKAVHICVERFSQGRSKIADDTRSVGPLEIATAAKASMLRILTH